MEKRIFYNSIQRNRNNRVLTPEVMKFYIKLLKEIILVFSHRIHTFLSMPSEERYVDLMEWNPAYLKSTFDKHIASFLRITHLTLHRIKIEIIKLSNDISLLNCIAYFI